MNDDASWQHCVARILEQIREAGVTPEARRDAGRGVVSALEDARAAIEAEKDVSKCENMRMAMFEMLTELEHGGAIAFETVPFAEREEAERMGQLALESELYSDTRFQCNRCFARKTRTNEKQMRSLDEAASILVRCICGHRWRVG